MEERHTAGHCPPYYLEELRTSIQTQDRIKALVLLAYFPTLGVPLQQRVLFDLSRDTSDFVVDLLGHLLANLTLLFHSLGCKPGADRENHRSTCDLVDLSHAPHTRIKRSLSSSLGNCRWK
jgi:hypothetical protein